MGFFDKLFNRKKEKRENIIETIYAPLEGKVLPLEKVPDQTFATKLLGNGIAIEPTQSGYMVSPVDGVITQIFETNHAFTVETKEKVSVLVHFGLDTVELKGAGFTRIAKEGDLVTKGTQIVKYDFDFLKENARSVIAPIVILDSEEYKNVKLFENKQTLTFEDKIIEVEI